MDPNATLKLIIEAAVAGEVDDLLEASANLAAWLEGGGFPPAAHTSFTQPPPTKARCRDCGEWGVSIGHQECQYPQNHD